MLKPETEPQTRNLYSPLATLLQGGTELGPCSEAKAKAAFSWDPIKITGNAKQT